ncbi:hypothetical protein HJG53_16930 [Sphingomonas sp. ID1715]|uniref:hypothetical protein n=1 Tax=Sphingomonas sp. ID1715 TaxID=1656898 RepID=UPI001488150F|nr:hypothetical protein [Sphingomonas sp. ID1715]NNM78574.1 hypothetical protein [Sphingomonas sp. ID1715]
MADPEPSEVGEIAAVMADPAASYWLKEAITSALDRDVFDAERDALLLARLLTKRLDAIVARHFETRNT